MIDVTDLLHDCTQVGSRGYQTDRVYPSRADPDIEPVRATAARAIEEKLDRDRRWHSSIELAVVARRHGTTLLNAVQVANIAEDDTGRWYASPFCTEVESPGEKSRRLKPERRRTA